MQIEPSESAFAERYAARRSAGGVDDAGRRPGDAGFGLSQARRRQADELPARVGGRRRGARPPFDHRHRARSDLAHERRRAPRSTAARASRRDAFAPCPEPPLEALRALIAESRIALPDSAAADGRRRVRLSRLRHGAADGGTAAAQSRSDRHSRRRAGAADYHCGVRRGEGFDHRGDAGAPGAGRRRASRARRAPSSGLPASSRASTGRSTNR